MRNKLMILAAGAILAIGAAFTGFLVINKPSTVAVKSVVNLLEDTIEREELELLTDAFTGGSVAFSLDSVTDEDGYNYLEDSYFRGKLYTSKEALMLTDVDVQVMGNKFAGELYVSQDEAYISEDRVLGGSYGLKFKELVEQLEDSIFAPDAGSPYEIPEEVFDMITESLEKADDNEKMIKDFKKLTEKLLKKVWKIAANTFEFEKETSKERINGEKTSVRLITMTIDDKTTAEFIEALYEFISETDLIIDFLEKYEDTFNSYMSLAGEEYSLVELYEDAIDDLGDEIGDIKEGIEDSFDPIKIKLSTAKLSAKLLKVEVVYDGDSLFTLDLGKKGVGETDKVTLKIDECTLTYTVKEDTKDKFNAEFVMNEEYSQYQYKYTVSLNIDKKAGKYQAKYENYDYDGWYGSESTDSYVIKGKFSEEKGATTFTIDSFSNIYDSNTYHSEDVLKIKASITIDPKDKMPKPDEDYKTIADISEDDIEEWFEKFSELNF